MLTVIQEKSLRVRDAFLLEIWVNLGENL